MGRGRNECLEESSGIKGYLKHDVDISVVYVCSSHLGCSCKFFCFFLLQSRNLAARFTYIAGHKMMFLAAGLLLSKLATSFNKSDARNIPVYCVCYMLIIIT